MELARIRRNRELWVQKEVCTVDWASGLPETFSQQSSFDSCCTSWHFGILYESLLQYY